MFKWAATNDRYKLMAVCTLGGFPLRVLMKVECKKVMKHW